MTTLANLDAAAAHYIESVLDLVGSCYNSAQVATDPMNF